MRGAGFPGPDVQNRARNCAPGAGCPGHGPDVRGARCPGLRAGCPGSKSEDELEELDLGAEIYDFKVKIGETSWMESGEKLDPQVTKQIHGSNSTKHHHTNKSQKKFGAIFGG